MTLAAKFILALLMCLLGALVLRTYFEVHAQSEVFRKEVGTNNALIARALRPGVSEVWRSDGREHALRIVKEADQRMHSVDIRYVSLLPDADPTQRPGVPIERLQGLSAGEEIVVFAPTPDGVGRMYGYEPLGVPARWDSAIEVSSSLQQQADADRASLHRAIGTALVTFVLSALTLVALGILIVGRPMTRLMAQARRIGAGDLTQRIAVRQRDEIGALAREMNRMTDQLIDSQERARRANDAKLAAVEQLRHAERLATVGRLAAGMAHELGTPLNVVQARARSIAEGRVDHDTAKQHAQIVVEQVDRMTRLMRQLLDFARKRELRKERVDLTVVAKRSVTLTAALAAKRGVVVDVRVGPREDREGSGDGEAEGVFVNVDPAQVEQVLTNLLTNAIHASDNGATITMSVEPRADGGACVAVRDRGVGIDPQNKSRIFEPFFTTKDVGQGTGLGLSVAYGIVQDHGGSIDVESEPGVGSTFTVVLPERELSSRETEQLDAPDAHAVAPSPSPEPT